MTAASTVLIAIATELAKTAKSSLPKLRDGEIISAEWMEDGIFFRETSFNGETSVSQYDFRQKKAVVWR